MADKKESGCDNCGKKANRYYNIEDDKFCLECAAKWIKESMVEHLLEDDKAILPGSGISYHQFKEPDFRILKTFDSPEESPFTVIFSTKELTALCPLTGMPDYYTLTVEYVPCKQCIESKSAKFYFHSYRDAGMFIEKLTNKIADDWYVACAPRYLKVTNTMAARGGIPITVEVERGER